RPSFDGACSLAFSETSSWLSSRIRPASRRSKSRYSVITLVSEAGWRGLSAFMPCSTSPELASTTMSAYFASLVIELEFDFDQDRLRHRASESVVSATTIRPARQKDTAQRSPAGAPTDTQYMVYPFLFPVGAPASPDMVLVLALGRGVPAADLRQFLREMPNTAPHKRTVCRLARKPSGGGTAYKTRRGWFQIR